MEPRPLREQPDGLRGKHTLLGFDVGAGKPDQHLPALHARAFLD
jgi:hypothetical protein